MAKLQVELVTAEGRILSEEADFVLAPGVEGDLGVLPNHIPLLTPLRTGEVMVRNGEAEHILFVAGGFLEVLPDKVTILADAAERAEDIDEARAEESRKRAQELLAQDIGNYEASLALERATAAVHYAAMTVDGHDPERSRACHVAKAAAGEAGRRILKDGIQIHGGIGYTWEHDLHLYLRRSTADEYLFGTTGWHLDRLADLLIDA